MALDQAAYIVTQIMEMGLMVMAVMVIPVFCVGLLMSLFQTLTQITEPTLSFFPKVAAGVAVAAIGGYSILQIVLNLYETLVGSFHAF